ncbi:MAG: flap endonuclease-1, partial [Candidatus Heimdallarchaeota archaeon]|nr:flap endonuclease-1 [Candidatus Heimdallarchaeota archaeon]
MGVKLPKDMPKHEITINDLAGGTYTVDAHNIIYQFLTSIRDRDTGEPFKDSKGRITSHISGLFYRNINFMKKGLKLVYVFDGKPPELKIKTREKRKEIKRNAEKNYLLAKDNGDMEGVIKYAKQTVRITQEIIEQSKEILTAMGIQWVPAPSEGEAQASVMVRDNNAIDGVISQDFDCLMFGAPIVIRNLSTSGRRKLPGKNIWVPISPEKIDLREVLKYLGINQEQLVILGMLVGTDYNPEGAVGIGPAKGLKIVKEMKTLEKVLSVVDFGIENKAVFEIFDIIYKPDVIDDVKIEDCVFDAGKIREILIDKYEFSTDRVENGIKSMEDLRKKNCQKS